MLLKDLLNGVDYKSDKNLENIDVNSLSFDTRNMVQGGVYFCLKGSEADGHNYAQIAATNGAKVLVVQHYVDVDLPQVLTSDTRSAMALMSANFYGNPAKKLKIIGVTGTNGKTSTTYILQSILKKAGYKVGVIGTIGIWIDDKKYASTMTTPDPIAFHGLLKTMVENKIDYVVMEVSAHAIALKKMEGIIFDVGILTNITQDHLDFFKTFSHYATTKLSFISPEYCKSAVVNVDDNLARSLFYKYKDKNSFCRGFGLDCDIDCFCNDFCVNADGIKFNMQIDGNNLECKSQLKGKFNLYNIMGAVLACKHLGIDDRCICDGVKNVLPVPGRFNVINLNKGSCVVVDYAHTPDGLAKILISARELCCGRLISVFGCGGNRDKTKRPIMGEISARLADYTIITSDNPRFEKPSDIILDIKKGIDDKTNLKCIIDREEAIKTAVDMSQKGDVIVVSGKGAEDYLEIKGYKMPYSDFDVINNINNSEVQL